MSKKKTSKNINSNTAAPAQTPPEKSFLNTEGNTNIGIAITVLFFILSIIGVYNHEPWRDEFQAYLIARSSHSLSDLFHNIKYEGHPPLWHLILFLQTRIVDSMRVMAIIHSLIATATVFMITRYFKFSLLQKILIPFGYFFFYEYNLVARSYTLGIFFLVLSVVIYKKFFIDTYLRGKNKELNLWAFVGLGCILFLQANTSVFGIVLALTVWALMFSDFIKLLIDKQVNKLVLSSFLITVVISAIGILLSYSFIKPLPDNSYPVTYTKGFASTAFEYTLGKIFTNYFYFPDNTEPVMHVWNVDYFIKSVFTWVPYVSAALFIFFLVYFIINSRAFLFYLCGTLGILFFVYLTTLRPLRYSGNLYAVFVVSVALVKEYDGLPRLFNFKINGKIISKVFAWLFILSLSVNAVSGFILYGKDTSYPFSNCNAAGKYLLDNNLEHLPIMGSSDFVVSPLTYFTHKPVLLAESKREQNFIVWDKNRNNNPLQFQDILSLLTQNTEGGQKDSMLMILSAELTYVSNGNTFSFKEDDLPNSHTHMKFLKAIDSPCMVNDEKYYIYLATRIKK